MLLRISLTTNKSEYIFISLLGVGFAILWITYSYSLFMFLWDCFSLSICKISLYSIDINLWTVTCIANVSLVFGFSVHLENVTFSYVYIVMASSYIIHSLWWCLHGHVPCVSSLKFSDPPLGYEGLPPLE